MSIELNQKESDKGIRSLHIRTNHGIQRKETLAEDDWNKEDTNKDNFLCVVESKGNADNTQDEATKKSYRFFDLAGNNCTLGTDNNSPLSSDVKFKRESILASRPVTFDTDIQLNGQREEVKPPEPVRDWNFGNFSTKFPQKFPATCRLTLCPACTSIACELDNVSMNRTIRYFRSPSGLNSVSSTQSCRKNAIANPVCLRCNCKLEGAGSGTSKMAAVSNYCKPEKPPQNIGISVCRRDPCQFTSSRQSQGYGSNNARSSQVYSNCSPPCPQLKNVFSRPPRHQLQQQQQQPQQQQQDTYQRPSRYANWSSPNRQGADRKSCPRQTRRSISSRMIACRRQCMTWNQKVMNWLIRCFVYLCAYACTFICLTVLQKTNDCFQLCAIVFVVATVFWMMFAPCSFWLKYLLS